MPKQLLASRRFWNIRSLGKERKIYRNKLIFFLRDCILFSSLQYELFLKILPKYIRKDQMILELGSGPGDNLVILNKLLGCNVYGIDNNKLRFKQNEAYFEANKIPLSCLKFGDFRKTKIDKQFDVVMSMGLIEHFKNTKLIIADHGKYLKQNGLLICTIPNYSGINLKIQTLADKQFLTSHNLQIMELKKFEKLFYGYDKLYCGYIGIFSDRIFFFNGKSNIFFLILLKPFKIILNLICLGLAFLLPTSKIKTGPYLIFIGRKII